MRFNKFMLFVAATCSSLVHASFNKRGDSLLSIENLDNLELNEECLASIGKYSSCYDSDTKDQETYCKIMESDICKEFFGNISETLKSGGCGEATIAVLTEMTKAVSITNRAMCLVDESGKLCPIAQTITDDEPLLSEAQGMEKLKENCKSKKCREGIISFIESMKNVSGFEEDSEELDKQLAFFNDESCIKASGADSTNPTGNTTTGNAESNAMVNATTSIVLMITLTFIMINMFF